MVLGTALAIKMVALPLPRLLERMTDRTLMVRGAVLMVLALLAGSTVNRYGYLLAVWFIIGFGYSLVQTPSGRLRRRSSDAEARPALFAAEFALSHTCWLVTYPAAGWLGTRIGMPPTFVLLAAIAAAATVAAWQFWPGGDPAKLEHSTQICRPTIRTSRTQCASALPSVTVTCTESTVITRIGHSQTEHLVGM